MFKALVKPHFSFSHFFSFFPSHRRAGPTRQRSRARSKALSACPAPRCQPRGPGPWTVLLVPPPWPTRQSRLIHEPGSPTAAARPPPSPSRPRGGIALPAALAPAGLHPSLLSPHPPPSSLFLSIVRCLLRQRPASFLLPRTATAPRRRPTSSSGLPPPPIAISPFPSPQPLPHPAPASPDRRTRNPIRSSPRTAIRRRAPEAGVLAPDPTPGDRPV